MIIAQGASPPFQCFKKKWLGFGVMTLVHEELAYFHE